MTPTIVPDNLSLQIENARLKGELEGIKMGVEWLKQEVRLWQRLATKRRPRKSRR